MHHIVVLASCSLHFGLSAIVTVELIKVVDLVPARKLWSFFLTLFNSLFALLDVKIPAPSTVVVSTLLSLTVKLLELLQLAVSSIA